MHRPSHWPLGRALCKKLTPLCWVCFMSSFSFHFLATLIPIERDPAKIRRLLVYEGRDTEFPCPLALNFPFCWVSEWGCLRSKRIYDVLLCKPSFHVASTSSHAFALGTRDWLHYETEEDAVRTSRQVPCKCYWDMVVDRWQYLSRTCCGSSDIFSMGWRIFI